MQGFSAMFLSTQEAVTEQTSDGAARLAVLDGWRGISILLVLACHLLPLGPKSLQLNAMAGPMGMALFFTLSGFLITRFLLHHASISDFLIRRFFRIVPLAWLCMLVVLVWTDASADDYAPNLLFYANLPPQHLVHVASHLWSLCVEMQFYVGIALLVRVLGVRGLYLLPALCLAVTGHRIVEEAYVDVVTSRRVDEILAGAVLAMVFDERFGPRPAQMIGRLNAYALLALLAVCSHPDAGPLNYIRPYVAALLVGTTLFNPAGALVELLKTRTLRYIAAISFALYVSHHVLMFTWLGTGDSLVKYAKRPLLIGVTFMISHLSTFYFEQRWIEAGRRLSRAVGQWQARVRSV